jgi:beta-carotene ketolase (CrtW type)
MKPAPKHTGLYIAAAIILAWTVTLGLLLFAYRVDYLSPVTYLLVLLQTHLYTGLFITAHDAMHGVVAPGHKRLNTWIGRLCTTLFVYNSYDRLFPKHHLHHRHAVSGDDPDYHDGPFLRWYLSFLFQYVTVWQIVLAAATYNLLILVAPAENVIAFWMIPSLLSTFQLFYFGTYLPHRGEHAADNPHRSRSQKKNHLLAFLSCYFFGYHYEHHQWPGTPWWQLHKRKEASQLEIENG